jgi:hypothetical protein
MSPQIHFRVVLAVLLTSEQCMLTKAFVKKEKMAGKGKKFKDL